MSAAAVALLLAGRLGAGHLRADESDPNLRPFPTPTGEIRTVSEEAIDPTNPFFGRFKGPILRGLAARTPYFHNASAATLIDVVEFYQTRFQLGLSAQQKMDLVAFLRSLWTARIATAR